MPINFKDFMGSIKKGVSGTVGDFKGAAESKKNQKRLYKKLIKKTTKKEFVKKYGKKDYEKSMTPGALINRPASKRRKIRKAQEKKYKSLK